MAKLCSEQVANRHPGLSSVPLSPADTEGLGGRQLLAHDEAPMIRRSKGAKQ
jgi:hypothetical protein